MTPGAVPEPTPSSRRMNTILIGLFAAFIILVGGAMYLGASTTTTRADETAANDWIEWSLDVKYKDAMTVSITSTIKVHEIETANASLSADEIRNMTGGNASSPALDQVDNKIESLFGEYIVQPYPGSTISGWSLTVNPTSLEGGVSGDAYDPPILYTMSCTLNLDTSSYFTAEELGKFTINDPEEFLSGCLLAGGMIRDDMTLYVQKGHKLSYVFYKDIYIHNIEDPDHQATLSASLLSSEAGLDATELEDSSFSIITLDALDDTTPLTAQIRLEVQADNPQRQSEEDWDITVNMDMKELDQLDITSSPLHVKVIDGDMVGFEPPVALTGLRFLSADTLRLLYTSKMVNMDSIETYLDDSLDDLEERLNEGLNATNSALKLTWDMTTLDNMVPPYMLEKKTEGTTTYNIMGTERPIIATLVSTETITPSLTGEISAWAARGFLNAGATTSVDLDLGTDAHYTLNIKLPDHLILEFRTASATSGDRSTYTLEGGLNTLAIASSIAPQYDTSRAIADIDVDIKDVQLTGPTAVEFPVHFNVDARLHRLDPDSIAIDTFLPERVTFDIINADAIRLAFQEGLITPEYVEDEMSKILIGNVTPFLKDGSSVSVILDNSSTFDGNIGDMTDAQPLMFEIDINGKVVVDDITNPEIKKENAMTVYSREINFPIGGLEEWTSNYHVMLPEGLTIEGRPQFIPSRGTSSEAVTGIENNRHYLDISLYEDAEGDINFKLGVTPGFVAMKAWPCFLIVLCVILLIILLIVILVVRSKNKKNQEDDLDQEQYPEMYEQQNNQGMYDDPGGGRGRGGRPPGPGPMMLLLVLLF